MSIQIFFISTVFGIFFNGYYSGGEPYCQVTVLWFSKYIIYIFFRLQLTSASGASKPQDTAFRVVEKAKVGGAQGSSSKQSTATSRMTPKGPLPPVSTRRKTNQIDVSDFLTQSSQETKVVPSSRTLTRSAFKEGRKTISELVKDSKEIKPLGSISKPVNHHKETRTSSPSHGATSLDYSSGSANLRQSRIPEDSSEVRYPLDLTSGSSGFRRIRVMENRIPTPEGRRSGLLVRVGLLTEPFMIDYRNAYSLHSSFILLGEFVLTSKHFNLFCAFGNHG